MIEVFKHFNSYDKSTLSPSFKPRERPSRQHKLEQSTEERRRSQNHWRFKNALDKLWEDDPLKFNHLHPRETDENEEWSHQELYIETCKACEFDFRNIIYT